MALKVAGRARVATAGGDSYLGMISRAGLLSAYERELLEEV